HTINTTSICLASYAFDMASQNITLPGGANPVVRRLIVRGTMSDGTTVHSDLELSFPAAGDLNFSGVRQGGGPALNINNTGVVNASGGSAAGTYDVTATFANPCPG